MEYTIEELQQGEDTLTEDCELCGEICCVGFILVITRQEWETIANALDQTPQQLTYATRAVPIPTHNPIEYRMTLYPCPFLHTDKTCIIHQIRPQPCRNWPYIKAINQTRQNIKPNLNTKCPAINKWKKRIHTQRQQTRTQTPTPINHHTHTHHPHNRNVAQHKCSTTKPNPQRQPNNIQNKITNP